MDDNFEQTIRDNDIYLEYKRVSEMTTRNDRCLKVIDYLTILIGEDNYNELNKEVIIDNFDNKSNESLIKNLIIRYNDYIFHIEYDELFKNDCRLLFNVVYNKEILNIDIFLSEFKKYFNHTYIQILNNFIKNSNKELSHTIRLSFELIEDISYINYDNFENIFTNCDYVRFNNKKFGNGYFYLNFEDDDNIPLLYLN